jgi:hypothetical protein
MTNPNVLNPNPAAEGASNIIRGLAAGGNTNLAGRVANNSIVGGTAGGNPIPAGQQVANSDSNAVGGTAGWNANPAAQGTQIGGVLAGANLPIVGVGTGAVVVTVEALVAEAGMEGHSIGTALWNLHRAATWTAIARVFKKTAARDPNTNVTNLISEYAAQLTTPYFLTIMEKRIVVLHALRSCFDVAGGGTRVLGLVGERSVRASGMVIQPKLHTLGGQPGVQAADGFARVSVAAATLANMQAAFAGDASLELTQPLPADPQNQPDIVTAFKTMPIHPQLAALFMKGLPICDGVTLVLKLMQAAPPEMQSDMEELGAFMRVAATAAADGTSTLASTWRVLSLVGNEALEEWYLDLVDREVPKMPEAAPPPAGICRQQWRRSRHNAWGSEVGLTMQTFLSRCI